MLKKHIHIVSQTRASIGEVTGDIINGLQNDFIITEESKGEKPERRDILLCHYFVPNIVKHSNFKLFRHKVLIFPVDGTAFVDGYCGYMNEFDLIITPANAGKEILEQNGVTQPIKVIPNFWKPEHLELPEDLTVSKNLRKEIKNDYVFYYEANYYPRKGFEELLRIYVKTFSNNIKKSPGVAMITSGIIIFPPFSFFLLISSRKTS